MEIEEKNYREHANAKPRTLIYLDRISNAIKRLQSASCETRVKKVSTQKLIKK